MKGFEWPVRVYWEDTDAGGVVYHTSYLRFFERGRTEWLRSLGYSQGELAQQTGMLFTVVDLTVSFAGPARLDDLLVVHTRVIDLGGASVTFEQQLQRQGDAGPLVTGTVRVACLDARSFKPRRLPSAFREAFQ